MDYRDPDHFHARLAAAGLEITPHLLQPHAERTAVDEHLFAVRGTRGIIRQEDIDILQDWPRYHCCCPLV